MKQPGSKHQRDLTSLEGRGLCPSSTPGTCGTCGDETSWTCAQCKKPVHPDCLEDHVEAAADREEPFAVCSSCSPSCLKCAYEKGRSDEKENVKRLLVLMKAQLTGMANSAEAVMGARYGTASAFMSGVLAILERENLSEISESELARLCRF